jgi:hypothetical protein
MDYVFILVTTDLLLFLIIYVWLQFDYYRYRREFNNYQRYLKSIDGALFLILTMGIALNAVPALGTCVATIFLIVFYFRGIIR